MEFTRVMHMVLGNRPHVEIYMDDLTIHSATFEEHVMHVHLVLEALNQANLLLKPSKCVWFSDEVKVLGHLITKNEVKMDPKKVEAIKNRSPPTTVKEVQRFIGLANYYRRFIKNFALIAAPLYKLLRKENKFEWNIQEQEAFNKLVTALASYPVVRHPDFSRQFIIHCDASCVATGALLTQRDDQGGEYVIAYYSCLLRGA